MENSKEELIDATMKIVSEYGINNFSMKQITNYVGVSEALIYKHFNTKDELLDTCFKRYDDSIGDIIKQFDMLSIRSEEDFNIKAHAVWITYFKFLLFNDYRTIFYFQYRWSSHYNRYLKANGTPEKYFINMDNIIDVSKKRLNFINLDELKVFLHFVYDTTGNFAQKIIYGQLPNNDETIEHIWKLIFNGIQKDALLDPQAIAKKAIY